MHDISKVASCKENETAFNYLIFFIGISSLKNMFLN